MTEHHDLDPRSIHLDETEGECWVNGVNVGTGTYVTTRGPVRRFDWYSVVRNQNRKARRLALKGRIYQKDVLWMLKRDGEQCLRCGKRIDLTVDHVVPLSRGGDNTRQNIQTLCFDCNGWKGRQVLDYRRKF